MGMEFLTVIPPPTEPVGLIETKLHLRVDHDHDDALIESLITSARLYIENYICGSLVQQGKVAYFSNTPNRSVRLPYGPVQHIDQVVYFDHDGNENEVDSSSYYLAPGDKLNLMPNKSWGIKSLQGPGAFQVYYEAGYEPEDVIIPGGTPEPTEQDPDPAPLPDIEYLDYTANIPRPIIQALLLLVGQWYENRQSASGEKYIPREMPFGVKELLTPYRNAVV